MYKIHHSKNNPAQRNYTENDENIIFSAFNKAKSTNKIFVHLLWLLGRIPFLGKKFGFTADLHFMNAVFKDKKNMLRAATTYLKENDSGRGVFFKELSNAIAVLSKPLNITPFDSSLENNTPLTPTAPPREDDTPLTPTAPSWEDDTPLTPTAPPWEDENSDNLSEDLQSKSHNSKK